MRLPLLVAAPLFADPLAEQARQVLDRNCAQCHGGSVKLSGLDLGTRATALAGGTRGPAIVPGNAAASPLYQFASHAKQPTMPPGRKLDDADLAALRKWIDAGAQWSAGGGNGAPGWWAFQKVARPPVPRGPSNWTTRNPIDAFVWTKLAALGLAPAPEADRATLARRLYTDLHGLAPTYEQVQELVRDPAPDAYDKLVARLLDSPRYGEKWGRHWLDLVRYSDTAGFELDSYVADAWRYRDYVIDSFNKDKPYDRFIKEQIAGDEYFPEDPVANTATGYFCVGPNRDGFPDQADVNRVETLTDYVDTTGAAFLGLTVGCARCHDHKYDPIPQREYYKLQAVFAPAVKTRVPLSRLASLGWDVAENVREVKFYEIGDQIRAAQGRCQTKLRAERLAKLEPEVREAIETDDARKTPRQRELATMYGGRAQARESDVRACLSPEEEARLRDIEKRLLGMFSGYRPKPFACGVTDVGDFAPKTLIPGRDGFKTEVGPGTLTALGGGDIADRSFERPTTGPIPMAPTTGRRHALAAWIASADNPLTARVMVNRIWQHHFGQGIVATPSNFGARGRQPTHPELLDWLAAEFVAKGWSVKEMHKLILESAVYRQSSVGSAEAVAKDPENQWISRFRRRRLNAEELRDSALLASGALNLKAGGRPVVVPLSKEELFNMIGKPDDFWVVTQDAREHTRRGIYLQQRRTFRLPMMEVFDAPESMVTCARRDASTTATQSLTLLNGQFLLARARELATKLSADASDSAAATGAWRAALARDPSAVELVEAESFLKAQRTNTGSREGALAELVRGLLNLNEFLYVD
jgi:hypothetical protein